MVCYLIYLYFKHLKSNKYKTKGLASVRLIIKVSIYEIKNASAYEKTGHNFYHFNLNITKEGLLNEFERQNKIRIRRESDDELERYCREVEVIIGGDYGVAEEREGEQCEFEKGKAEVAGAGGEVGGREEGTSRRSRRMAR